MVVFYDSMCLTHCNSSLCMNNRSLVSAFLVFNFPVCLSISGCNALVGGGWKAAVWMILFASDTLFSQLFGTEALVAGKIFCIKGWLEPFFRLQYFCEFQASSIVLLYFCWFSFFIFEPIIILLLMKY